MLQKKAALVESLQQNPKWGGALTKLDCDEECLQFSPKDIDAILIEQKGATPFIVAVKAHHFRYEPQAWSFPGFGAFVSMFDCEGLQSAILLLPIDAMLEQCIALPDVPKFLETNSGTSLIPQIGELILMSKGDVACLPSGWLSIPIL